MRVLGLWGVDKDLTWTVELLVAELATNVVRHARTPYTIILSWDEQVFRGEVNDANQLEPRAQPNVSTDAVGGRGLLLVSKIATAWGVHMHDHGKTVWFTIAQLDAD